MDHECSTRMSKSKFKKHQSWIALAVTITFAWLLQVSAMPLAAADTTKQIRSGVAEPAPGFIEQTGTDWGRVKPKASPLLLLAAVVALALLYLLIHGIDIDAAPGAQRPGRQRQTNDGLIKKTGVVA